MIYENFVVSTLLYEIEHCLPLSRHPRKLDVVRSDASKQSSVSPDYITVDLLYTYHIESTNYTVTRCMWGVPLLLIPLSATITTCVWGNIYNNHQSHAR